MKKICVTQRSGKLGPHTALGIRVSGMRQARARASQQSAVLILSTQNVEHTLHPPQIASLDSLERVIIFALVSCLNKSIL